MLLKDFAFAGRTLRKSPLFTITAIVTIGLGIGASTAIFSVANAVLLRPLPYREADRLVVAGGDMRTRNVFDERISYENYSDLKKGTAAALEDMAAVATFRGVIPRQDGTPELVKNAFVTTNFMRVLGAKIVAGRDFEESDGQAPPPPDPTAPAAAPPPPLPGMTILSYEYWQRRFGGDPTIFGRPIPTGAPNAPVVIGALAPGFELEFRDSSNVERKPDLYTALRINFDNRNRNTYFLRGIGRLRPGVSLDRLQQQAEQAAVGVRKNFSLYATANFHYHVEPMKQHMVAEVRPAILALMGAVAFLLLIACANVANLMLVRMSLRERELAVRTALGGNRWRLIRQMLAESLLLGGAGTLLGVAIAYAGVQELIAISPPHLPRLEGVAIDRSVLLFSILAGLCSAVVFGIAPALRASRPDVMDTLRSGGRSAGLAGGGFRSVVAVVEVALSYVLLIGCGLMVRSFIAVQHVDLGMDPNHLLTFQVAGGRPARTPEERKARAMQVRNALQSIAGVESVAGAALVPLAGGYSTIRWGREDALADASRFQAADVQTVQPGFFETLRTRLIAGRTFGDADNAPDRKYVVVDTILAGKAYPRESAVGKRILIRVRTPEPEWVEIIGVVAHQRAESLSELGHEQLYFTDGFQNFGATNRWMLRTAGDPVQVGPAVRAAIRRLDPNMLIAELEPMTTWVDRAQAGTRFSLVLIGVFAIIAAVLAAVGLYGVLSTFVRQRTAEIGLRMALGAAPSSIFGLVVGHGLGLSAAGIGAGIVAAAALTRMMATMLIGVKPTDPVTYLSIIGLFLAIAAVSCWIPARRAAGLPPTAALRE